MSDTTDAGPLTPNQVRWLKIAVVVMGIMIVAGIAILIGRVLYLASQGPRQATQTAIRAGAPVVAEATLALPAGASIRNISYAGDRLAIHYEGPRGTGIMLVDTVTGARLGRFDIVPEPPR